MKFSHTSVRWYLVFGAILMMAFLTSALTPDVLGYEMSGLNNPVRLQQQESTATRSPTVPLDATATLTATLMITPTDTLAPTATITPTSTRRPTATPIPTPRGDTPETARVPMFVKPPYCIEEMCPGTGNAPAWNAPGSWTWIEPRSSTWYKLHGGRLQVLVWLFANGQRGITFDVYAPDQKDLYGKPVGRGSFNPSQQPADLFYSGRTQAGGIWYVRVNNDNPFPVAYSLRYTTALPSLGNVCNDCHNVLGDLMFDRCFSGDNSSFCDDLRWLYEQNPSEYDHSIPGR